MSDLPDGWIRYKLNEICNLQYGKNLPTKLMTKTGYPVFGANGQIGFFSKYHFEDSKVLITCRGATCGTINRSLPKSFITNNSIIIDPLDDFLDVDFLEYALKSINRNEVITGTAQPQITLENLNKLEIIIAPFNEQRRIVAKLRKILLKIQTCQERLDKIPAILKRFRQAVLASACSGRLTADWREKNSDVDAADILLKDLLKKRKEHYFNKYKEPVIPTGNILDGLPRNWCYITLDQVSCLITSGSRGWAQYYSENGSIFIRAQNINTDKLVLEDIAHVNPPAGAEGERTKVCKGDLLITITGANVTKSVLVEEELQEAFVSQHVGLVRLVNTDISKYIYLWIISSAHGRKQLLESAYGAGKPGLNLDNLRQLQIALPPLVEQQEIVKRVEELFKLADRIEERYQKAKSYIVKLTQSILTKAFRGELVAQDPNDEPAFILLERIKKITKISN